MNHSSFPIKNERDQYLQSQNPRLLPAMLPPNYEALKALWLTTSSPGFKVDSEGNVIAPISIKVTAHTRGLVDLPTFTIAGASLTDGSTPYEKFVFFDDVTDGTITIGVELEDSLTHKPTGTESNKTYAEETMLTVTSDGDGSRGAGHYYILGSAWSDALAHSALPSLAVIDDHVTISDGVEFVYTKKWDGFDWVDIGTVINGHLLVTKSVTAAKVNTNGLDIRAPDGTLVFSSSYPLGGTYIRSATIDTLHIQNQAVTVPDAASQCNFSNFPEVDADFIINGGADPDMGMELVRLSFLNDFDEYMPCIVIASGRIGNIQGTPEWPFAKIMYQLTTSRPIFSSIIYEDGTLSSSAPCQSDGHWWDAELRYAEPDYLEYYTDDDVTTLQWSPYDYENNEDLNFYDPPPPLNPPFSGDLTRILFHSGAFSGDIALATAYVMFPPGVTTLSFKAATLAGQGIANMNFGSVIALGVKR